MTCRFSTPTAETWPGCKCRAKTAECRAPARQHPNTPPLDPAGFHSRRVLTETGEPRRDYFIVNSLYCTARTCRNYEEGTE